MYSFKMAFVKSPHLSALLVYELGMMAGVLSASQFMKNVPADFHALLEPAEISHFPLEGENDGTGQQKKIKSRRVLLPPR